MIDYKAALNRIEPIKYATVDDYYIDVGDTKHILAIQSALRLSDMLQSGEISDDVLQAGIDTWTKSNLAVVSIFKAMVAQLLKKVQDKKNS